LRRTEDGIYVTAVARLLEQIAHARRANTAHGSRTRSFLPFYPNVTMSFLEENLTLPESDALWNSVFPSAK